MNTITTSIITIKETASLVARFEVFTVVKIQVKVFRVKNEGSMGL
jgi:hypothetical protein